MNVVLINTHPLTKEKKWWRKKAVYAILEDVFESLKETIVLILDDFNAKIGWEHKIYGCKEREQRNIKLLLENRSL